MPALPTNFARMSARPSRDVTDDAALGGRLRLLQPRKGHRFGHDAILLAAATDARAGEHAVDLGAGVGCAGLALAARVQGVRVTLVEIDETLAALAMENAARNAMAGRAGVAALDVAAPAAAFARAGLGDGCADHVLMNPPFHDAARTAHSPDAARRAAHVMQRGSLREWVNAAARLLRPGGVLTVIYRADGRDEVTAALAGSFGALKVLPVYPKPDTAPIRVIVRAVRGGGDGATVTCAGLHLNGNDGRPTVRAEAILREAVPLAFAPDSAP
jgi:tRNA1(Val) A37 N6-methylase TrmN6